MITDLDIQRFESEAIVPPLKEIEQWMEKHNQQMKLVERMHHEAMGRKLVKCPDCGKGTQIASIVFTDHYRYSPSYSSWEDGEWYLSYSTFNCSKCGIELSIKYEGSTRYSSEANKQFPLRKYAKEIREEKNR